MQFKTKTSVYSLPEKVCTRVQRCTEDRYTRDRNRFHFQLFNKQVVYITLVVGVCNVDLLIIWTISLCLRKYRKQSLCLSSLCYCHFFGFLYISWTLILFILIDLCYIAYSAVIRFSIASHQSRCNKILLNWKRYICKHVVWLFVF